MAHAEAELTSQREQPTNERSRERAAAAAAAVLPCLGSHALIGIMQLPSLSPSIASALTAHTVLLSPSHCYACASLPIGALSFSAVSATECALTLSRSRSLVFCLQMYAGTSCGGEVELSGGAFGSAPVSCSVDLPQARRVRARNS